MGNKMDGLVRIHSITLLLSTRYFAIATQPCTSEDISGIEYFWMHRKTRKGLMQAATFLGFCMIYLL